MARVVEFDVERIFRRLSVMEGTQIKYAGGQAMKRLGFEAKQHVSQWMAANFEDPVAFTLSSPRYTATGLETRMFINSVTKGNAPSEYLYPVSSDDAPGRKSVFPTRFNQKLRSKGLTSMFAVPARGGRAVRLGRSGMRPAQYAATLAGLLRDDSSYFLLESGRGLLRPGIYQRSARTANRLFLLLDSPPTVGTKFNFGALVTSYTRTNLPRLLSEELRKALR